MFEPYPTLREVILTPVSLRRVNLTLEDVSALPILDESGNWIQDEEGRSLTGEPA